MLTPELKQKILEYLQNKISLHQLEEWMVTYEAVFLTDPDSADADAISAIELGLAEWSDGLRTEENVRRLLTEVIEQYETVHFETLQEHTIRTIWSSALTQHEQDNLIEPTLVLS